MTDRPPTFPETLENYRGLWRAILNRLAHLNRPRTAWLIVLAAVGYYVLTFSAYSVLLHQTFETQAFDAGIEDQGAWLLSQFTTPFVTVRGMNIFGDSVTLYHFLAAAALRLWDNINVLFILQALVIGLGAIPLFLFAKKELKQDWLAAPVALAYLLYPALQNMNLEQYHPEALAVTALILTLFFLQQKNYRYYYLWLAFALIAKDEVSLTGIFFGLYLVLFKKEHRHGWWTAGLSLTWYLLCSRLFLPLFNEVGVFAAQPLTYSHWFRGLMANLFNPQFYLQQIFHLESLAYYFGLLAPLAFIPLFGPAYLFLAIPSVGLNVLSGTGYIRSINYHYNYVQTAILFFALVNGLKWLRQRFFNGENNVKLLGLIVLVSALLGNIAFSHFPLQRGWPLFLSRAARYYSKANQAKLAALKLIPADAKVSASFSFVPHLSHRREIYLFPNPFRPMLWGQWFQEGKGLPPAIGHVDYLVIDQQNLSAADQELLASLVDSKRFEPIYDQGQTVVLKLASSQEKRQTSGKGPPELLKNPGFERGLVNKPADWQVECWQDDKALCEYTLHSAARSGRHSAMIRHNGTADSRWVQEVKVEPDTTYRLAGWVKTVGVGPAGTGAFLQIAGAALRTRVLRGDNDWTLLEVTGRTPEDTAQVKIECRLGDFGATTKGTAYFDEISWKKVPSWPK